MAITPVDGVAGNQAAVPQATFEDSLPPDFVPTSKERIITPTINCVAWRRMLNIKPYAVVVVLDMRRGKARPFMVKLLRECDRHGLYEISRDPVNRYCYSATLDADNGKYSTVRLYYHKY
jgi:hypothetical protein